MTNTFISSATPVHRLIFTIRTIRYTIALTVDSNTLGTVSIAVDLVLQVACFSTEKRHMAYQLPDIATVSYSMKRKISSYGQKTVMWQNRLFVCRLFLLKLKLNKCTVALATVIKTGSSSQSFSHNNCIR